MNDIRRSSASRPEWMAQARRYEHDFLTEVPIAVMHKRYPEPRPLVYDVHDVMEVGIVLAEGQERHFEGYSMPGQAGDVWLCAMWEPHGTRVTRPDSEIIILVFLPAFLGDEVIGEVHWLNLFSVPPGKRPRVTTPEMRARVLAIASELREEIDALHPGWPGILRAHLIRLLTVLYRGWERPEELRAASPIKVSEVSRLMPSVDALHAHPERPLSVPEAAALCSLSNTHFQRLFTHAMGMSFFKFSLRARLAYVADRLLRDGSAVEDIARASGFVDASHLHRHFLKHYGLTPGQYRKRNE